MEWLPEDDLLLDVSCPLHEVQQARCPECCALFAKATEVIRATRQISRLNRLMLAALFKRAAEEMTCA